MSAVAEPVVETSTLWWYAVNGIILGNHTREDMARCYAARRKGGVAIEARTREEAEKKIAALGKKKAA